MAQALSSRPEALDRLAHNMPTFTAIHLAGGKQKVTSTVMAEGAVVITRHDAPTMVLM